MIIGVLALQGNFAMHQNMLSELDVPSILVKYPHELEKCDGLIIPGGESTTMSKLIDSHGFRHPLIEYAKNNSIFGTCAGMILLSSTESSENLNPLNIMNFTVIRNGWGRQIFSFTKEVEIDFSSRIKYLATFIRAPKIATISDSINVLSKLKDEIILLSDGLHLASSFHPEFGSDILIHNYFINLVKENEKINSLRN
ncbi:MAG: pyridoxal 5'-phosphate synthase glutaminase subunit PdxT [Candidatus Marinimicrobia bacterium]|nr:pyridoxal 5'-phosphate synthase glutaminase subunit PdxT [Candidatus Neomarinimicrobiota bacterium]